jgi:hypothetical protein
VSSHPSPVRRDANDHWHMQWGSPESARSGIYTSSDGISHSNTMTGMGFF